MRQVEAGCLDELALGADPLEEHHQLQRKGDRVDARPAPFGVELSRPRADDPEVQFCLKVVGEVVDGNLLLRHRCAYSVGRWRRFTPVASHGILALHARAEAEIPHSTDDATISHLYRGIGYRRGLLLSPLLRSSALAVVSWSAPLEE